MSKERIPYHPAYGYATPEQIKKLQELKHGPEYDFLWKQIAEQIKKKGKIE